MVLFYANCIGRLGILLAVSVYKFYPSFSNDCNDSDVIFRYLGKNISSSILFANTGQNVIKIGENLYAISEKIVIDKLMVHGTVNLTKRLAGGIKISQTGFVFHYAIGMISGIAIFCGGLFLLQEMN